MPKGSIRKRGSKYHITVDIGKDEVTGKRKRHYSSYSAREEAETAIRTLLDQPINKQSQTICEFLNDWIKITKRNLNPNTAYVYERYIKLMEPHLPNIPMNHLRRKQAELIINSLLETYQPSTVSVCRRLLATAYNRGVEWEEIEKNPFSGIRIKQKDRNYTIWHIEEINRFLNVARDKSHNHSYYLAFLIAIHTGMRKSEILGLRWCNIDLDKRIIHVKESIHELPNKGKYVSGTKTKKSNRYLTIPNLLVDELRTYKQNTDTQPPPNDYVIITRDGKSIHPRNLTKHLAKIIAEENLPRIRFHDFRHIHASILLANGINPKDVQARLGHSKIDITLDIYSHIFPNLQHKAADLLDDIFRDK